MSLQPRTAARERGSSGEPGTAKTSRPCSAARRAVIAASGWTTLVGVTWTLIELGGQPVPPGAGNRAPTLVVETPAIDDALLVDGWAAVFDSPETNEVVFVQPGKAVLHVSKS